MSFDSSNPSISICLPIYLPSINQDFKIAQDFYFDINRAGHTSKFNYIKKSIHHPDLYSKNISLARSIYCNTLVDSAYEDISFKGVPSVTNFACHSKNLKSFKANFLNCIPKKKCFYPLFRTLSHVLDLHSIDLNFRFIYWIPSDLLLDIISKGIKMHRNLESFICLFSGDSQFTDFGGMILFKALQSLKKLKILSLDLTGGTHISDQGLEGLSSSLSMISSLVCLEIKIGRYKTILSSQSVLNLASALKYLTKLQKLTVHLHSMTISARAFIEFFDALGMLINLNSFAFHSLYSKIPDQNVLKSFATNLIKLPLLKILEIYFSTIENAKFLEGFTSFANSLSKVTALENLTLRLEPCYKSKEPLLKPFSEAFSKMSKLKSLNFCLFKSDCIGEFYESLMHLTSLSFLRIYSFEINDSAKIEYLHRFQNSLSKLTLLTHLEFYMINANILDDSGAKEILSGINYCKNLEKLIISFQSANNLTSLTTKNFGETLASVTNLKHLKIDLSSTKLNDDDLKLLFDSLRSLIKMEKLILVFCYCNITDKTIENIIAGIKPIENLKEIDFNFFDSKKFSHEPAFWLHEYVQSKKNLKKVNLNFSNTGMSDSGMRIIIKNRINQLKRKLEEE